MSYTEAQWWVPLNFGDFSSVLRGYQRSVLSLVTRLKSQSLRIIRCLVISQMAQRKIKGPHCGQKIDNQLRGYSGSSFMGYEINKISRTLLMKRINDQA